MSEVAMMLNKVGAILITLSIAWSFFVLMFAYKIFKETKEIKRKNKARSEYIHKYTHKCE